METNIYRIITLSTGREVKIYPREEINKLSNFDPIGYNRTVMENQIENCGYIIVDAQYGDPIDNEYDLDEIYSCVEKNV